MATIYDYVTPKAEVAYWNEKEQEREPFLGEAIFPDKKQLGTSLEMIKGSKGTIRPLMLSAYDAKAIPLGREAFEVLQAEIPFFKNSKNINEKQRQALNNVIASGNEQAIRLILGEIFNDVNSLLMNASVGREMLRMQALTTGALAFSSNGQTLAFDYGVPEAHKVTPSVKWDVPATADPIGDIESWREILSQYNGTVANAMLCNSVTFGYLRNCVAIKDAIYVLADGKITPTKNKVKEYLSGEFEGLTCYIYDKGYEDPATGAFTKFVPDGVVVLFPDKELGNTVFGTTPEESDLLNGGTDAEVEIVDTGVAVTGIKEKDPVNVMTKVSQTVMPSFELADSIIIANVKTA